MESDDSQTIEDPQDAAWISTQRQIVERYLVDEGLEHDGVSREPRWFVSPYVAIWAIRSKKSPDRVGWWAISGDLPTDYMTTEREHCAADILRAFAARWRDAARRMALGMQPDGFVIGPPDRARELAPLLEARSKLLKEFAEGEGQ
jgi:hypothetical protein